MAVVWAGATGGRGDIVAVPRVDESKPVRVVEVALNPDIMSGLCDYLVT